MTDLPLFYRAIEPLDRERHRDLALVQPQRFDFARGSHLVPAVVDEFAAACRHLPILFLPESLGPTPVFLTGLKPGQSSLVDEGGAWNGRYLPAYLRRYPFILGEVEGADPLVCIDPGAAVFGEAGEGAEAVALFGGDGREGALLTERIRLVTDYAAAAKRTATFGRTLQDLSLFRPLTVEGRDPLTGAQHALHGVLGVDEAALAALPVSSLDRLRTEGWLAAIYAHLVSLQTVADFTLSFAVPSEPMADRHRAMGAAA